MGGGGGPGQENEVRLTEARETLGKSGTSSEPVYPKISLYRCLRQEGGFTRQSDEGWYFQQRERGQEKEHGVREGGAIWSVGDVISEKRSGQEKIFIYGHITPCRGQKAGKTPNQREVEPLMSRYSLKRA